MKTFKLALMPKDGKVEIVKVEAEDLREAREKLARSHPNRGAESALIMGGK